MSANAIDYDILKRRLAYVKYGNTTLMKAIEDKDETGKTVVRACQRFLKNNLKPFQEPTPPVE